MWYPFHVHGAMTQALLRLRLAHVWVSKSLYLGPKMQYLLYINIHGNADWSCFGLEFVRGIQYRQIYSYNGKVGVDLNSI